jgi:hypothetical protein
MPGAPAAAESEPGTVSEPTAVPADDDLTQREREDGTRRDATVA